MSFNHSEAFYYCDQLGGALAEPTNNLRQAVLAGLASDLAIDPDLDHWWIGKYNYTLFSAKCHNLSCVQVRESFILSTIAGMQYALLCILFPKKLFLQCFSCVYLSMILE